MVKDQSQQIQRISGQIDRQSQQIHRQSQEIQRQSQQLDQISKDKEQSEKTSTLIPATEQRWPINEIFEWKIPNIRQVLLRSVSGTQSLVSEPFYLFRCGYKYLLKIEIRKSGWDFLLFVYIKVVPGKFDESLSWPCKEKVRATLVNQNTLLVSSINHDNQGNKSKVIDFEKGQVPCYRPLRNDCHEYRLLLEINLTDLPHDYYKINDTIFIRVNRE